MNPNPLQTSCQGDIIWSPYATCNLQSGNSELNSVNNTFSDSDLKSYYLLILYPYLHPYVLLRLCHFSGSEGNLASAETSEEEVEGQKFIVNGEEAQEQLTRDVIQREEKLIYQRQRPFRCLNHGNTRSTENMANRTPGRETLEMSNLRCQRRFKRENKTGQKAMSFNLLHIILVLKL